MGELEALHARGEQGVVSEMDAAQVSSLMLSIGYDVILSFSR